MIVIGVDPGQKHWAYWVVGDGGAVGEEGRELVWTGRHPAAVTVLRRWLSEVLLLHSNWPHTPVVLGLEHQFRGQANIRMETALYTIAEMRGLPAEVVMARESKAARHAQLPKSWAKAIEKDTVKSERLHVMDAAWVAWRTAQVRGIDLASLE